MKSLQRYILKELLQNVLLTLAAIIAIYFVVTLALVLGTSRVEGVPFAIVLRHTGGLAVSNLHLTLPLTVLTACIFSYGRMRAEKEFTAARVAGIHPWRLLAPALLLGAVASLALAWLQDEVMPDAHFRGRTALQQDIFEHLEDILKKKDREHRDEEWSAVWNRLEKDGEGHIILRDLQFLLFDGKTEGKLARIVQADWAKPAFDRRSNRLTMQLRKVRLQNVEDGVASLASSAESLTLPLNLNALAREVKTKRTRDMSYEELLTRVRRLEAASDAGTGADGDKRRERILDTACEFHSRAAFAGSGVLFALFGAALGLLRGTSNRALVFLIGFLVVVLGYYPLMMAGEAAGRGGLLPPPAALWVANAALLAVTLIFLRRLFAS